MGVPTRNRRVRMRIEVPTARFKRERHLTIPKQSPASGTLWPSLDVRERRLFGLSMQTTGFQARGSKAARPAADPVAVFVRQGE